ncbi:MAG TPA: asparagine synthase (glutamine-hydrolyzing), partial [Legionellales bacterium]|nr:asparagine synthase (glutamine-hydrolyzing) [Legionellales bacterium]
MCGIAGLFHFKNEGILALDSSLKMMNRLLQHRGPDGQGIWLNPKKNMGLAHQRLSIIDLSEHASQPMVGQNGFVITFNGEIYNHIELRQSLSSRWDFYTASDTEVILAAYAVYGMDCVKHLKGMFSFAIWDGEQLFCARDHFGIKPFYFSEINDVFYFASEPKALLPFLPLITTNSKGFTEYMTFQYSLGSQTLFEGVEQLEPAHAMVLNSNGKRIWRYWDANFEVDNSISEEMCNLKLSELLDESIRMHLRADVPIAAYVSGGIDSSLIG